MAFSGRLHGSSHGDMERYHRRILDALIAKDVESAHAALVEHASLFSKAIDDNERRPQAVGQ
jgi:DNA-binding GntR family transcriptional regulator